MTFRSTELRITTGLWISRLFYSPRVARLGDSRESCSQRQIKHPSPLAAVRWLCALSTSSPRSSRVSKPASRQPPTTPAPRSCDGRSTRSSSQARVDSSASTPKSARRSALENNASASRVDICRTDQGGATMVEPLSPMALPRRVSGGVFGFTAVSPTGYGAFKLPIDWGQSIYTAQRASFRGSLGRAIVPNGSTATRQRRRLRFYGCFSHRPRCLQASDRLGTIDLH